MFNGLCEWGISQVLIMSLDLHDKYWASHISTYIAKKKNENK